MGQINLYKIDENKKDDFLNKLTEKFEFIGEQDYNSMENEKIVYTVGTYINIPEERKPLEWQWILDEYDYEIEAVDGKVMEYEVERAGASSAADGGDFIGSAKAERIALDNAGLAKSEVRKLKTELDSDGTIAHYDVEFVSGGFEYEYEINAKTGAIIASEKDRD